MFRNYIKIAWRNLIRNRTFSLINILGLSIGIATCLMIGLYVFDELSFDRFNEKSDRIVRVVFKGVVQGGKINESTVMPPTAKTLQETFPEVAEATRIRTAGRPIFKIGEQVFTEENMAYVDPNFFRVFTLPLIHGNAQVALNAPNTAVISETTAKKLFGTVNVLNQELYIQGNGERLKINGVMKDIPQNAHFHFDVLASMEAVGDAKSNSWMSSEYYTYLVLKPGYDYKKLQAQLPAFFEKYAGPQFLSAFGMSYQDYKKAGNQLGLYLQPLTDIHLHSDFAYDLGTNGDVRYVYIFSAIAVLMLLIASINFMNLSTAGASRRAKEVGIRKVLGSDRRALAVQFFIEAILLALIAVILSVLLLWFTLPVFNQISGKSLSIQLDQVVTGIPLILLFSIFVGLFAGSYPALYLSSFNPLAVLKNKLPASGSKLGLRAGLVVFQFIISTALIFCTLVVSRQLHFIQSKKLGYSKEQVLILPTWPLGKNAESFKNSIAQDNRVSHISGSGYIPAGDSFNNNFFIHTTDQPDRWVKSLRYDVDENYIPALDIQIKSGRNFSKNFGTDSLAAIVNETAAQELGWNENALGKSIVNKDGKIFTVVGVVKDFHFKSLHEAIAPLVMVLSPNTGNLIIKTKPGDLAGLLQTLEKQYKSFPAELPFSYSFLDDRFNNTYLAEQKTAHLLTIFAGLSILVACLGLFGLALFTANQRIKEISIRKVLGASVSGLIALLSYDFLKLVCLAALIACPIAWWIMSKWLENFAYRMEMKAWMFIVAGSAAILIALITVGTQAIRAALSNPIDSLRNE